MTTVTPTISKSQYIKGQQCPKALWYYKNRKDLAPEIDAATQAKYDVGTAVGVLAQQYFGGGVEVTDEYWDIEAALQSTRRFIDEGHEIIFEATAMHSDEGCYSRIDVLRKVPGKDEWDLIEVKSSTEVKDYHYDDVGFQYYVFTNAGYNIRHCFLMYINNQYVKQGDIDPQGLFTLEDITEPVLERQCIIEVEASQLIISCRQKEEPTIRVGARCSKPFSCDYIEHCWKEIPEYSIYSIFQNRRADQIYNIIESYDITDVPEKLYPSGNKLIDLDCYLNSNENFDRGSMEKFVGELVYPLYYLDYETIFPGLPVFDGTRPYQQVPFQFSLHIQHEFGGELIHHEFLHKETTDPRKSLAEFLVSVCGKIGSVIVWNQSFEADRNKELAEIFPQHAEALLAINERMLDLMVPFRERALYSPKQKGRYSLKNVLPAFTGLSYEGMDIANGGDASQQYYDFVKGKLNEDAQKSLWESLLEYCKLDTIAMVEILAVVINKVKANA